MEGSPAVVDALNEILTAELTAINQYFVHAKMCENWGYQRLAEHFRHESIDEMHDAERLVERILYLDGIPNLQRLGHVAVGEDVPEQLRLGLDLEKAAIERYNRVIALCVAEGDNGSREILEGHLRGEEEHTDWLEAQLHIIDEIGVQNYLSEQIRGS